MSKTLLSFGHGYSARALAKRLIPQGWTVYGTTRNPEKLDVFKEEGVTPILWSDAEFDTALAEATCLLISAGPDAEGDPVLRRFRPEIEELVPRLTWAGYLSTTGVYGDHQGGWVTEDTPLRAGMPRGQARVVAENQWGSIDGLPLHIFRLAGIYGPGRGPFQKVRSGKARRIIKDNQIFSRIHVEDIAQVLQASIERPNPGRVYNVCDNDPAPPEDVIAHAAELLGLPVPPDIPFDEAEMTPMARSFYAESKRVDNTRIKDELGVDLLYPDYRTGLAALLAESA